MQSDRDLVHRAQRGDRQAYGVLVERYERAALATARHVLGDSHAAEDATQEAFVAAYRGLVGLRDGTRFGAWVLKIVQRESMRLTKQRRRTLGVEAVARMSGPDLREADERSGELDQNSQDVLAAVQRLPPQERVVVALRYFDGLSVAEIARATGRPLGTVTKQLSRSLARLRQTFQKE